MLEAIVLSRRSFKEYDEVISLYAKELGKIEVTARGIKKITSKNSSFLEPFSAVQIGTVPGKDRLYITTSQVNEYFSSIRTDYDKLQQAAFVVSWLEKMLSPGQKDPRIYEMLFSWLNFLNTLPEAKPILLDAFLLKMLSFLGFEPQLQDCIHCEKNLEQEPHLWFSFLGGGLVCQKDKIEKREELVSSLNMGTLLSLRYILVRSWKEIVAFGTDEQYPVVHALIYKYLVSTTEKSASDWTKSPEFSLQRP